MGLYISIVLLVAAIFLGWYWFGRLINPVSVFNLFWLGAISANRLPFLELYTPSDVTFLMFSSSAMTFTAGFLFTQRRRRFEAVSRQSLVQQMILTPSKSLLVVQMVALFVLSVIMLRLGIASWNVLLSSHSAHVSAVRTEYYETGGANVLASFGGVLAGKYGKLIFSYGILPGVYCAYVFSLVRAITIGGRLNYLALVIAQINIVFLDAASLGRTNTIFTLLVLLGTLVFIEIKLVAKKQWQSFRNFIIAMLLLGTVLIVSMTVFRLDEKGTEGVGLAAKSMLSYYGGPISALDQRERVMDGVNDNFCYSFGGFYDIFDDFWRLILRHRQPLVHRTMDTQVRIEVAPNLGFNALYTWCLNFYQDFGIGGIIFMPCLYGLFIGRIYRAYLGNGDMGFYVVFLFFYVNGLWSVASWHLEWAEYAIPFTAIFFLGWPRLGQVAAVTTAPPASSRKRFDGRTKTSLWQNYPHQKPF